MARPIPIGRTGLFFGKTKMSYFDEWIRGDDYTGCEGCFTHEEGGMIYSIGCRSYGATRKKTPQKIREQLSELGMERESINSFIEGVFYKDELGPEYEI